MKKAFFTLAVLVMAFGNMGLAQSKAELKAKATQRIFKQLGLTRESYIVPQQANFFEADGTQHRTTYYYDESEFTLYEEVTEVYNGSWTNQSRVVYEYDFYGNVLEMTEQEWGGDDWVDAVKASYTYDIDVIEEVVYQIYTNGNWVNTLKEVYNFNGDQWTILFWDWNGSNWTSDELYTFTRDNNVVELLIQYMETGAWQNGTMVRYTYNFDENLEEILYQDWNAGSTTWDNFEKVTYIYEDGVYTEQFQQYWGGEEWENNYYFKFEYDGNGNAKNGYCFEYEDGTWVPADGDIEMAYGYNTDTKEYEASEVNMEYVDLTGVGENAQAVNMKLYPVPAENELFIQTEGFLKAEVYTLTGRKLMESTSDKMNVGSLSQGVYVLKVFDQTGKAETRRIVVR